MANLKILVTGGKGQLASAFKDILTIPSFARRIELIFLDRDEFDITDPYKIKTHLSLNGYDFIINTAAYTNVDGAETSRELAELVNHTGVVYLAKAIENTKTRIIHISTDYVFSGESYRPYTEKDEPCPTSYYGETKLRGEQAILNGTKDSVIIRTSWLYYLTGLNFVRKILTLAIKGKPLEIVSDQIGSPTDAEDLAKFIINRIIGEDFKNTSPEIYHYTNSGIASWYDLAMTAVGFYNRELLSSSFRQEIKCQLSPTTTERYPTAAKRPPYSVLSLEKIRQEFGVIPPHWQEPLREMMRFGLEKLVLPN